jgi:hypothetical protein
MNQHSNVGNNSAKKEFLKKLPVPKKLFRPGSGSRLYGKSDPNKNRPDPQQ